MPPIHLNDGKENTLQKDACWSKQAYFITWRIILLVVLSFHAKWKTVLKVASSLLKPSVLAAVLDED